MCTTLHGVTQYKTAISTVTAVIMRLLSMFCYYRGELGKLNVFQINVFYIFNFCWSNPMAFLDGCGTSPRLVDVIYSEGLETFWIKGR
jgi:hypothetical protein